MTAERRSPSPEMIQMAQDIAGLKKEMMSNTEITQQVADLLASFRVMAAISKWVTVIAGAAAACIAAFKAWK